MLKGNVLIVSFSGSAADMSKRAMIMLGTNEELKELGFKMLFPVHDIYVNKFVVLKLIERMQKRCCILNAANGPEIRNYIMGKGT